MERAVLIVGECPTFAHCRHLRVGVLSNGWPAPRSARLGLTTRPTLNTLSADPSPHFDGSWSRAMCRDPLDTAGTWYEPVSVVSRASARPSVTTGTPESVACLRACPHLGQWESG